jgi:hypothetical protein
VKKGDEQTAGKKGRGREREKKKGKGKDLLKRDSLSFLALIVVCQHNRLKTQLPNYEGPSPS